MRTPPLNPFSVQAHGPGNIEYLFEDEAGQDQLIAQVRKGPR